MSSIKMDEVKTNDVKMEEMDQSEDGKPNGQIEYIDFPDNSHSYYSASTPSYKKGYLKERYKI